MANLDNDQLEILKKYKQDLRRGNLSKLAKDDEIQIFNSTGNMLKYIVFDKYETSPSDIDCLKASIDNIKEITLITCNNLNGNRLIVKAKYVT